MAYAPAIGAILSSIMGSVGANSQNKANLVNSQNANTSAGRDIWNSTQMVEQLLSNLTGGGKIQGPQAATPGAGPQMGGGIMGTGGQMMQPMQGQGGSLPPQLMQFLQQLFQQSGGKNNGQPGQVVGAGQPPTGPGQIHMGVAGPTGGQGGPQIGGGSPSTGAGGFMAPGASTMQNPNMIRPM
jgi:hypothetical protein